MIYVDSLPYSSAVPYELEYVLDVAALRIGIPWTFHFFSPTYAPYAAQMFRNFCTPILSAITIRRNTYAATFRNVGTPPHSPCIAVRTGLMMTKIVRT